MEATAYLSSLGICYQPLTKMSIGRLSVSCEFFLDGSRGVVVRPKRGGVSDRYLDLLAAEGIKFVIVDAQPFLQIYECPEGKTIEQVRALPIKDPNRFPSVTLFKTIADLLLKQFRHGEDALVVAAALFAEKIDDEQREEKLFCPALASPRQTPQMPDLLQNAHKVLGERSLKVSEAILSAAAMLSGYRVTPANSQEAAILIDGLAGFSKQPQQLAGLPESFAFAFSGPWISGSRTVVVSQTIGSQLLALNNHSQSLAVLPASISGISSLLRKLFSNTTVLTSDFLEWSPNDAPDRVIVVPPLGSPVSSYSAHDGFSPASRDGKRLSRTVAEILYIEHAIRIAAPGAVLAFIVSEGILSNMSHADFRSWLLEQGRLLTVVSLPTAHCFAGSSACCSLLFFQKVQPPPPDYPILMMEVQEDDLLTAEGRTELQKALDRSLAKELPAC